MDLDRFVRDSAAFRLETDRLVLRCTTAADLPVAIAHEQDRRIMRWIRDPQPEDEIRRRCEQALEPWSGADGRWLVLAVQERAEPTMIGIVCCRVTVREHETFELGYRLHPDVHRRGFGHEACRALVDHLFGRVGARKVVAFCVAANEPSWRLMAKLGMRREAELREHSRLDGAWRDEFVYGLLAREWRADGAE